MKLRYILEVLHNVLIFQILDQDEELRCTVEGEPVKIECPNGLTVASSHSPDIEGENVWIRGLDTNSDSRLVTRVYDTPASALIMMGKVQEALTFYCAEMGGTGEVFHETQRLIIYSVC